MHNEKQIALNKMLLTLILLELIIYKIMLTFRKGFGQKFSIFLKLHFKMNIST